MCRSKPLYCLITAIAVVMAIAGSSGNALAQCYGPLMISPTYFEYDYLVRLCVHFGDVSSLPEDVVCSRGRDAGEDIIQVPIYFYNGHEGISRLEFAIESNDSILSFAPENCFEIYHSSYIEDEKSGINQMNIKVLSCMPVCGPALAGYVYIAPAGDSPTTWINLAENAHTHRMYASDPNGDDHYLFSPHHGGYVGDSWLYTCQEPICEEPNLPVTSFVAEAGFATAIRLTWTAGSGDRTVIRARTDRFPTGYDDGRLVVEMASVPGQRQYYFDTGAELYSIVYYKAFSLTTGAGGEVLNNSYVECSATDTVFVHGEISVEEKSWGAIKMLGSR
ncbi:MAG TPA: hypothetical protein VLA34_05255 [Candidatus Krumholzibacterium sp.]|nr:hypothetical protein [Candidatus Krumholzibacterium sp.]